MFSKLPYWIKNKYTLSVILLLIWVLFFDQNNIIVQASFQKQLNNLNRDKAFYTKEIIKTKTQLNELTTNQKSLEKFAREKYFMKKDNEKIFIFSTK